MKEKVGLKFEDFFSLVQVRREIRRVINRFKIHVLNESNLRNNSH